MIPKNLGLKLLAVWLILAASLPLLHVQLPPMVLAVLAIAAGVLLLIGK
jgi:hypothetical protein